MKPLHEYINEAGKNHNGFLTQQKRIQLYKSLLIDDRERLEDIDRQLSSHNTIPSFEDIEQFFWKGDYKDRVDDYYRYVTGWLKNIKITPEDIVAEYSLARSGKQMKIEVIATVIRSLISYYSFYPNR